MRLELPFPVSVNAIWRGTGKRIYRSDQYKAWVKEADAMMLVQQAAKTIGEPVKGHFNYHVSLDWSRRKSNMDGDNYGSKVILDYLQKRGLIENDSLADQGTWAWAPVSGAVVTVHRSLIQRAA